MDDRRFDVMARSVGARAGRRGLVRGAVALAVASVLGREAVREAEAETFSRKCKTFLLTGGPKRNAELKHIDDDVLITLIPKDPTRQASNLLNDDDRNANTNNRGDHVKPIEFDARVGDQIRIVATNWVAPKCELDELWLFCADGKGGGKKILDHTVCSTSEGKKTGSVDGRFLNKTIRIRP